MAAKQKSLATEEKARETQQRRIISYVILGITFLEFLNFLVGPFGMPKGKTPSDFLFLLLLIFYAIWAIRVRGRQETIFLKSLFITPETLLVVSLVFFLLDYLFASTASMSYAQRFALTAGNLRLAPDSTIQRLNSISRYLPLLLIDAYVIVYFRIAWSRWNDHVLGGSDPIRVWGLPITFVAVFLYTISLPSFLSLAGLAPLAYLSMVPLFLVFYRSPYRRGVFYGASFGVLQTMLVNFWLGTFSLVSLQFVTVVYVVEYTIFMYVLLWVFKHWRTYGPLVFAVAWVGFDYVRSLGFLGFPWGMLGPSQYQFLPLIQIASVTGVWGVTFIVTLVNAGIAHSFIKWYEGPSEAFDGLRASIRTLRPTLTAAAVVIVAVAGGAVSMHAVSARPVERTVRVALIQQDTDPHKNDYAATFKTLRDLTNEAMKAHPNLVVWSETAFVPNIRRWSGMDPNKYPLAKLVDEFLSYQKGLHTWLVTGNDDYTVSRDQFGNEVRKDYNAAVLFSPDGERMQTYHKIHLVPFTEYFPYQKQLPWLYHLLQSYDVYLWEPGTQHVVFDTPDITFSTPICFEDSFPNDVRQFVTKGAQAIINLSNDYWSLSKVEGKQHYINSLFRAVENRRPLLRATASGLTAYVNPEGRLIGEVPYYTPDYLMADVKLPKETTTVYTRFGDWFPQLMLLLVFGAAVYTIVEMRRQKIAAEAAKRHSKSRRKRKRR